MDRLEINGEKYLVVKKVNVEDREYIYASKMDDDGDITENFYVFTYDTVVNGFKQITDSEMLKKILLAVTAVSI